MVFKYKLSRRLTVLREVFIIAGRRLRACAFVVNRALLHGRPRLTVALPITSRTNQAQNSQNLTHEPLGPVTVACCSEPRDRLRHMTLRRRSGLKAPAGAVLAAKKKWYLEVTT